MILIVFLVILIFFSKGGIMATLANGHDNTNEGD